MSANEVLNGTAMYENELLLVNNVGFKHLFNVKFRCSWQCVLCELWNPLRCFSVVFCMFNS